MLAQWNTRLTSIHLDDCLHAAQGYRKLYSSGSRFLKSPHPPDPDFPPQPPPTLPAARTLRLQPLSCRGRMSRVTGPTARGRAGTRGGPPAESAFSAAHPAAPE